MPSQPVLPPEYPQPQYQENSAPSVPPSLDDVMNQKIRLEKVSPNASEILCKICMNDISPGEIARKSQCMHSFHPSCIEQWVKTHAWNSACPDCDEPLLVDKYN